MKRKRIQRGAMLFDLLVASLMALIVGGGLLMLLQTTMSARNVGIGRNNVNAWSRKSVDILADCIRNAQSVQTSSSPVVNSALQAASATSVTCYTNSTGSYTRYWLSTDVTPPVLRKTTSAGVTTTLVSGVTSLSLTYYVSGGQYTATSANWVTTANSHAPTSSELPKVGAIGISATLSLNGYTRQYSAFVRLRNSPL